MRYVVWRLRFQAIPNRLDIVSVVASLLYSLRFLVRSRAVLHLEILALRHQLVVTSRSRHPRLRLTALDRAFWVWLAHQWRGWRSALHVVQPATVLAWHRRVFVLVILAHDRRRIVYVAVTDHPTAEWTAQQLRNSFPEDKAPGYLLHDRDSAFAHVATSLQGVNIEEVRGCGPCWLASSSGTRC